MLKKVLWDDSMVGEKSNIFRSRRIHLVVKVAASVSEVGAFCYFYDGEQTGRRLADRYGKID